MAVASGFRVVWFLEKNKLCTDFLSGFRKGCSLSGVVIKLVTSGQSLATKRGFSEAVFLDIRGAFNSITHVSIFCVLEDMYVLEDVYMSA